MNTVQHLRVVGHTLPFSEDELEVLLGASTTRRFAPGETLCRQARPATSCFILLSGVIEVVKEADGRERVLTELSEGAIAGQLALVDGSPRSATLRAKTDVTALEFTRDVFMRLVGASSPLAYRFQVELAVATGRQLREANRRLSALFEARERRATHAAAERAVHQQFEDVVGDLDLAFEPFDVVEITPPERVVGLHLDDAS
ncbi:MAG: cyclic nucleotide-binding domain-containing protein [Myxococcaceae bacterium]|nr:MAG: cyclic nucleotide-binding domain-containing protein [Myxococcaceae bacterium]